MIFFELPPDKSISLFVKNIMVFEEEERNQKTVLPFFADGYPGLIFQETEKGLLVSPHNKQMPVLFLYGQTIKPIELVINGSYKLIIFQFYPFVLKQLFNITPKDIADNCYDLHEMAEEGNIFQELIQAKKNEQRVQLITNLLFKVFKTKHKSIDSNIKRAVQIILDCKGQLIIKTICRELNMTVRTFERRFLSEIGITAKQFCQIIQFQQSLKELTHKEYSRLTDIVYSNGFADQSHFIRVFKAFTGSTPKKFIAGTG